MVHGAWTRQGPDAGEAIGALVGWWLVLLVEDLSDALLCDPCVLCNAAL